ncbi:DUF86 domain-containing protein (plasmid) [Burkholderia sp. THE68]|uniref:HepT-like ribonuclease domain-containing protein n=1 Tax=Burkholderia sp. THE68 TaxID=758782 RepID=UPI001315B8D9|nr:HepT-like ribonuclease domain-containing protein [Burkholderia sp. THE68]BBU32973.1 DUF86 domain-containing protein [Burkholderia sp. THE68]
MSRDALVLADYLGHICTAIERIERYTAGFDRSAFLNNELVQDVVIRNFEIVGEASRNIGRHYPEFAAAHSDVDFSSAYEMRNVLAHGYHQVEPEIVWKTIVDILPAFGQQIQTLIATLNDETSSPL